MAIPARAARISGDQPSALLAPLLTGGQAGQRLDVFDVGTARSDTINYFSRQKCRLYFADLYAELSGSPRHPGNGQGLNDHFKKLFNFPADTRFDICLLWDIPFYLDASGLRALGAALKPWLKDNCHAHGLGLLNSQTALPHLEYAVAGPDTLRVTPRSAQQLPVYFHSQALLADQLGSFGVGRAVLLGDGRLEYLLPPKTSKPESPEPGNRRMVIRQMKVAVPSHKSPKK